MSLKKKLILNNVGVIVIFGLILFFQFNKSLIGQKREIRKGFQENAEKISNNLIQNFYFYYHNVQAISKNAVLKTKSFEENNFLLNELVSLYPVYDFMVLTDLDGNYIASNSISSSGEKLKVEAIKGKNFKSSKWFSETKSGTLTENFKKKIFGSRFGDIQKSSIGKKLYGKDKKGFHVSTLVQDEYGDSQAILTTFISSKWINQEIKMLNESLKMQGMQGAIIKVFNKNDKLFGSSVTDSLEVSALEKKNILEKSQKKESSIIESFFSKSSPLVAYTSISGSKFLDKLGWQTYVEMSSEGAFSSIHASKSVFSMSFFASLIIASVLSFLVSTRLSKRMTQISESIGDGASEVNHATEDISKQASLLSDSTTEQASSLQETVSSLTEISAMVSKNTSHSQSSKELSLQSRTSANSGVETIGEMLTSIEDISDTNSEIIEQMNRNSKEMSEITKVISDIEEKTKVINDIVFQTKLLSFNASVEAARAGEHGKGFSVVAEEVGNLAKTSGDAAREIEELLATSIGRVDSIVDDTKVKVESLISKGTEKVNTGKHVANKCKEALEEILGHSVQLDQAIEEIATASIEQSKGIDEIAKAMEQLDVVTRKNSEIAKVVSKGTEDLSGQAENLTGVSSNLTALIYGKKVTFKEISKKKKESIISSNVVELRPEPVEEKSQVPVKKVSGQDFDEGEWEDI